MPFFSPAHRHELVNQFWTSGRAHCPHDGAALDSHLHAHPTDYLLVLACLRCGKKTQVTRYSDPHRSNFRPWTSAEVETLADSRRDRLRPVCPVCQSPLTQRETPEDLTHTMECLRCGNLHQRTFPVFQSALSDCVLDEAFSTVH